MGKIIRYLQDSLQPRVDPAMNTQVLAIKHRNQTYPITQRRPQSAIAKIDTKTPFPFLRLPTEIRILVYSLLFAEHQVIQPGGILTRATYTNKLKMVVLNKQIYTEAAPILNKAHIFSAFIWRSSTRSKILRKILRRTNPSRSNNLRLPAIHAADKITRLRLSIGLYPLQGVLSQEPRGTNALLYTLDYVNEDCTNLNTMHLDFPLPGPWVHEAGGQMFRRNAPPGTPSAHPMRERRRRLLCIMWDLIDRLTWLKLLMNARGEEMLEPWRTSLALPELWNRTLLEEPGSFDEAGEPMDLAFELDCRQHDVNAVRRVITSPG